jgi:TldD protein
VLEKIDPAFLDLPSHRLAEVALDRATQLGARHAAFHLARIRDEQLHLRDGELAGAHEAERTGVAVRVVCEGTWGFAAGVDLAPDAVARLAERAVEVATVSRAINGEPVQLADEPVYPNACWVSEYEANPFTVASTGKVDLLAGFSARLLASPFVDHVMAKLLSVQENKFYADVAGTQTTQQRIRIHPQLTAASVAHHCGGFETMRTLAPPVGRGWEYLTGTGWDWDAELSQLPDLLAEKTRAPSVQPGRYDLVIDPSNLWLTIHESVGHATELDRALGYEAAYAGSSFATPDQLGELRYGSAVMNVTADRVAPHGLATIGFDDEGVAAQSWDLIKDGVLVGYQLDRGMARRTGSGRSNGCSFAESAAHVPMQRMPNVSLQPSAAGRGTDELIGAVDDGIYVVGDKSWSIDMQRLHFQFTGQRFYRIHAGRLAGQLRDVAYQATTTEFWGSLAEVGGPQTYRLCGADYCGKAQPVQIAAASHGTPSALFRGVSVLNPAQELAR